MCTAILSVEPGAPVLLAGVRDEFTDRAWRPPGRHWPQYPGLVGGLDLLAGGTWLAVAPSASRVAAVLNGIGRPAPPATRRSRGALPLAAAAEGKLTLTRLDDFDPFHLLVAEPAGAWLATWDGERLTERELGSGLHMMVNSGLAASLLEAGAAPQVPEREHELARIRHFLPRLAAAARPAPRPGDAVEVAWGEWLPLVSGDGLDPGDPRALIVRRDLGGGRIWGTTSVTLVALGAGVRYDFTAVPVAWRTIDNFE
jgi:hypothetical protein